MSAQIAIPDSKPIPLPLDPASPPDEAQKQRQERKKSYPGVLEFLKNTCKRIEAQDSSDRLNILGQQNRCQAFYDDRQYGKINSRTGEWEAFGYDPKEFKCQDNKYKEQIDKLQMEMARTAVDLNVEPTDTTDSAMAEAAEFAKFRIETNRKRLFIQRPEFRLTENMALLLKTITFRYVYFDKNAEDGPKEQKPKFGKTSLGESKSLTVCAICQTPRQPTQDEPDRCPKCGSSSTKTLSTSPVELDLPQGSEEVLSGLPRCVHADPAMIQVSLNARMMSIASSPFLIWIQMVEQGKLERMFPDKVIPTGDDETDRQSTTRRENETAVSNSPYGSSLGDVKGGEQFQARKFKLIWLDRWIYDDYSHSQPQKLPDGRELPANTPLGQFYPKGMCLAKVGDTLLASWSEDKNKKWSCCVYGLREHAFHGSGTNALIPIQITINDLLTYRVVNVYYNTAPREFIRKGSFPAETLPSIDKVCVVTDLDNGEKIVGNAYDRAPGTPLPAEVSILSQEQRGSLQEQAGTSGTSPVGTSAEQLASKTATAIAYMRDQAVGRMGPNLMLGAAMEVETGIQILECEQANYSRQQLMAFAGLKPGAVGNLGYTARGVDAFINCNIRQAFSVTPAQGSWMPTTDQEHKADALAYADAASKVQDPETLAHLAKVLKQPVQIGGINGTDREAQRRIEEFAKVVNIMASRGYVEPSEEMAKAATTSAPTCQISNTMDNHPAFISFYQQWWVSDESRNAPPLLRKVIETTVIGHKDAMTEEMTDSNARTLETQVPNQVAQMATSAMQPPVDDGTGAAAAQTQMGMVDRKHEVAAGQAQNESEVQKQAALTALAQQDREHEAATQKGLAEHGAVVDAANREHEAQTKERINRSSPASHAPSSP